MVEIDETFWTTDHLLELEINGEVRQSGHLSGMMWQPAELIAEVSQWMTLEPGDLVFTGTPPALALTFRRYTCSKADQSCLCDKCSLKTDNPTRINFADTSCICREVPVVAHFDGAPAGAP